MMDKRILLFGLIFGMCAAVACSDDLLDLSGASGGTTSSSGAGGGDMAAGAGGATASSGSGAGGAGSASTSTGGGLPPPTVEAPCQGHVYACGDLIDNDNDGLVDYLDPDCLGACDDTEDGLYGGISGQPGPACTVDCYFDQDSGSGNDDCHWNHECDPNEVAPHYYPEPENGSQCEYDPEANTPGTPGGCDELYAQQSDTCETYCGPLTPNGCDCFGCCELPAGSGAFVWLGSEDANGDGSCTLDAVEDPERCHPCLPVAACLNDCGPCELCVGKTTIPDWCFGGTGGGSSVGSGGGGGGVNADQCAEGVQACGLPGQPECPVNYYCVTGCCQKLPS
jgi:hypothetical protein